MFCHGEVACPGCKFKTKLEKFRYPGFLGATLVSFECSTCLSTVLTRLTRAKGTKGKGELKVESKLTHASPLLIEMLREDEEHRKKSLEEIDQE
jgi:hypothetical protein